MARSSRSEASSPASSRRRRWRSRRWRKVSPRPPARSRSWSYSRSARTSTGACFRGCGWARSLPLFSAHISCACSPFGSGDTSSRCTRLPSPRSCSSRRSEAEADGKRRGGGLARDPRRQGQREASRGGGLMPRQDPGPSVKDAELYERLREQGESKEKAARIANEAAREGRAKVGERGGRSPSYEDWTVEELRERAGEVGIEVNSDMTKDEL